MEKALTSGTSSAVIAWSAPLDHRGNRRLQLVAKSAKAWGCLIENVNTHLPIVADIQESLSQESRLGQSFVH